MIRALPRTLVYLILSITSRTSSVLRAQGPAAKQVIFLSADAFGVLPPVSILNKSRRSTTSSLASQLSWLVQSAVSLSLLLPSLLASARHSSSCILQSMLRSSLSHMEKSGAKAYLVNTGWNGTGKRISIRDTRGIIDRILITRSTRLLRRPFLTSTSLFLQSSRA
jgi:hypothetical protein